MMVTLPQSHLPEDKSLLSGLAKTNRVDIPGGGILTFVGASDSRGNDLCRARRRSVAHRFKHLAIRVKPEGGVVAGVVLPKLARFVNYFAT